MASAQKTVLVTGASGYVAGWVISKLTERGYNVRGTVRNPSDAKYSFLKQLFPKLELFEADLLKEGSFDRAVDGCEVVFHTASPFIVTVNNPEKDLVEPALNGTLNVLRAVGKAKSVKRVIVTSSVAAISSNAKSADIPFNEDDWNLESRVDFEPYRYSKTVAEKAAWDFAQGKPFSLVVMNPAFVIGPVLSSRSDATSIQTFSKLLDGSWFESGTKPTAFAVVDVRDVAEAHVRAAENEAAKGRFILASETGIPIIKYADVLRSSPKYKGYKIPEKAEASGTPARIIRLDISKAKRDLQMEFIPFETSVLDMADSLIKFGIVENKLQDQDK